MRVELELQHIQSWTDHLGRKRYRFRRRGYPRVELPVNGDPDSVEFQAAYHAAMRGEKLADALNAVAARGGSGTVNNAVAARSARRRSTRSFGSGAMRPDCRSHACRTACARARVGSWPSPIAPRTRSWRCSATPR